MNLKRIGLVFSLGLMMSCSELKEASLNNFAIDDDVFESGKILVGLTYGLHNLEETNLDQTTLLIGVHGSNSRGYEWVYPLQRLNQDENLVLFYRWNDN